MTSDPARRLAVDDPALVTALIEFLNSPDWGLVQQICAQHPVLLDDRADQALVELAAQARLLEIQGLAESITLHRRVLARVREVGAQQAAAEMAEAGRQSQEYLLRLLYELGAATLESVSRLRDLITNRPEVLSLEFDALVGRFLASYRPPKQTDNPGTGQSKIMVDAIRGGRRILRWCREDDVDTAFTRLESALARSTELTTLVDNAGNDMRSYLSDHDPMALRGAAETSVAILDHPALLVMMSTTAIQVLVEVGAILQERCRVEPDLHLLELRVHAAQRGLEEAAEGSAERFVFFGQLGYALSERGMYTGSTDDMRHAAGLYRKAMSETPEDAPEWADRVNALGAAHHDLYRLASASTDLDAAIELFGQAATGKPSVLHRGNLAMALRDRFTRDGDSADLERAIAILNEIVSTTLDTQLRLPRFLADLATAQLERFTRAADSEGLDDAIRCCERALTLGLSISDRVNCLFVLSQALRRRFEHDADAHDIDYAIRAADEARAICPPGSVLADQARLNYTWAFLSRYQGTERDEDLWAAVSAARDALRELPERSPVRDQVQLLTASLELAHSRQTGDLADIDRAIELFENYPESEEANPGLPTPMRMLYLASLYLDRGRRAGSIADLDRALALADTAPGEPTPSDISDIAVDTDVSGLVSDRTDLLAQGWHERFTLSRDLRDLDRAFAAVEQLPRLRDEQSFAFEDVTHRVARVFRSHDRAADGQKLIDGLVGLVEGRIQALGRSARQSVCYVQLLSDAYAERYRRTGDLTDLRRGTDVLERQLPALPPESPDRGDLLCIAGARWSELYTASGDPEFVRTSITYLEQAMTASWPGSETYRMATNNLGTALRARFNYTGDLADLNQAIDAYSNSIADFGDRDGGSDLAVGLSNLANALRARYELVLHEEDLTRAIALHERAIGLLPPGDPELPNRQFNLGTAYLRRYETGGEISVLNQSMAALRAAVDTLPAEAPHRAEALSSLGELHRVRFKAVSDPADLDRAVRLCRDGAAMAELGTPRWIAIHAQLGKVLAARFDHLGDPADAADATKHFRTACQPGGYSRADVRRDAAFNWASWAAKRGEWEEATEAYRVGLRVVDELLRVQLSRGSRRTWIRTFGDFTADAAYAFVRAGDPQEAVMAVEVGRAVSLSEALELDHADLRWLADHGHEELSGRFHAAVQRWRAASGINVDQALPEARHGASDRNAGIRSARAELDALAQQIREVSGRQDFLGPPVFADVAKAATEPLVYLAAASAGGIALMVGPGGTEVTILDLPGLTASAVRGWMLNLLKVYGTLNWWTRLDAVGRTLWSVALGPIVEAVGSGGATLIPAGYLELLPLSAAWTPDDRYPSGRRYAIDTLTLRYAPNARVAASARARGARISSGRLLAVQDPQPVSAAALRGAAAEVTGIACHFADPTVLPREQATPQEILARLRDHDVVHLACHGYANLVSPLDSALLLAGDQRLTLRDILSIQLAERGPIRLAVLSACETNMIGVDTPNEVVSLASGLLEAGVAGVVATQWKVSDLSSAMLMIRFYETWRKHGLDPVAALQSAQRWMRDTTNGEKAAYLAPDAVIATGLPTEATRPLWRHITCLPPEEHSFAHPCHWSGFVYLGG